MDPQRRMAGGVAAGAPALTLTARILRAVALGAAVLGAIVLGAVAPAEAQPRDFQLVDGSVRFVCEGPDVEIPAWGRFGAVLSKVTVDPADVTTAKGHAEVVLSSVNTEDSGWDLVFRKAEFLGLDEFPKSSFAIRSATAKGGLVAGEWTPIVLRGEFILHGVSRELTVPATVRWVPGKGAAKGSLVARAFFRIRWQDYNIPVPTGITRTFAGDGGLIQVELKYTERPRAQKTAPKTPSQG